MMFDSEIRLVPQVAKPDAAYGITWCFPGSYSIGMTGLGYQLVWWLMEQDERYIVRRCFTDAVERGARESDLFGFTVSWELDFASVMAMLESYSIPVLACDRSDEHPLVFGGGPVLSANPEPFADFFDVILLGDAETSIPSFLSAWDSASAMGGRRSRLESLAGKEGLYVPSLYECEYDDASPFLSLVRPVSDKAPPVVSKSIFRPGSDYIAHSVILSPDTTWGDTFLLELVRSCPQECRFCLASYLTRPFRMSSVESFVAAVDSALPHTRKLGLMGPSITEHPQFLEIAKELSGRDDIAVSLASVRADTLDLELASLLAGLGQRSVTIAIESGSERLRKIMKKNLTEEQILAAVENLDRAGFEGVKFYGIAGLPFEEWEDLDETIRLLTAIKKAHRRMRLVFGLSSFVPKAQTPFQRKGRDRKCKEKLEYLRKPLARIGVDVRPESHNWSDIQALLSRGDRRLTPVLLELASGSSRLGSWRKALRRQPAGFPGSDFYIFDDYPEEALLPWSHLTVPERTDYMDRQLEDAGLSALERGSAGT